MKARGIEFSYGGGVLKGRGSLEAGTVVLSLCQTSFESPRPVIRTCSSRPSASPARSVSTLQCLTISAVFLSRLWLLLCAPDSDDTHTHADAPMHSYMIDSL